MSRIPLIQLPAPRAERPNDPLEEKTFKEEVLFNSSFVKMVRDDIKLPDGGLSKRLYLTHSGACAMVALGDDGTILLERQWRHPLKRSFWELPAGKIDPNEEEIACAKRELIEECGVQAQEWTKLGVINNAIGYSNEHIAIYLARGLTEVEQKLDEGEFLEVYRVPFGEAWEMAVDGRITDVKTISGIFWLKAWFERNGLEP